MKRRVIKIAVLLLAGAIANVTVAWIGQLREARLTIMSVADWDCGVNKYSSTFGSSPLTGIVWHVPLDKPFSEAYLTGLRGAGSPSKTSRDLLPRWCSKTCTDRLLDWNDVVEDRAAGWPFLCVCCALGWKLDSNAAVLRGGIRVPSETIVTPYATIYRRRALPFVPIWPGFAINTIFYAAILWVLFAVPLALRRRRRMRRGLCPACAYPVGTSAVCTECGLPITPTDSTNATQ